MDCQGRWRQSTAHPNRSSYILFLRAEYVEMPLVEDLAPPLESLPDTRPTTTHKYQIRLSDQEALILGLCVFCMVHVGLVDIGKTYVPQPITTIVASPLLNEQGASLCPPLPLVVQHLSMKN